MNNQWHGIVDHEGFIDALLCPCCVEKFPFRAGLVEVHDLMGALDRRCSLCNQEVSEWVKTHSMKEAA